MKILDTPEATLAISEREDCSYCLTRKGEEVTLYRVILPVTTFVIADSKEAAIHQAQCILNGTGHDISSPDILKPSAEKVPFGIRGWGTSRF